MNSVTLYPELIDYIYQYCDQFQTPSEMLAVRTFRHDGPGIKGKVREMYIRKGWISEESDVNKLLNKGFATFKEDLAIRIFNSHTEELNLNLCPKCFKITRTPWAKQCRFCFHDWH